MTDEMDLATLKQPLAALPYRPLFATVSGAHLYGFAFPDSDVDVRGAHVLPVAAIVGLSKPQETIMRSFEHAGREIDLVAHDVKKFLSLMLNKNGYVLEQLYSPLVVHCSPVCDELRALGQGCITRQLYHHYNGFALPDEPDSDAAEALVVELEERFLWQTRGQSMAGDHSHRAMRARETAVDPIILPNVWPVYPEPRALGLSACPSISESDGRITSPPAPYVDDG